MSSNVSIVEPKRRFDWQDLKEIYDYRELLYFFAWRDLKVRYKQTAIGISWALLQPLLIMIIFSLFFGRVLHVPSNNIPYPIFVYTGILFWQFFSSSLSSSSNSLIENSNIITKVYFPASLLPISSILVHLVDLGIGFIILIAMMAFYKIIPSFSLFYILPLLTVPLLATTIGAGLFLSAINVKYRDVRYALPFFIQLLLFITPVIYPTTALGKYSWLISLNPMAGVIETMRTSLLTTSALNWSLIGVSFLSSLLIFLAGTSYFQKASERFADII